MRLVILSGMPGTGKSTLAERVGARLRMQVRSVDPGRTGER